MTQVVRVLGQILNQKRATSEIALIAARDLSGNLMPDICTVEIFAVRLSRCRVTEKRKKQ